MLSCYCTLLCSQPFVIFNYLCLPCDCIFPQVFSVLLIVFATNIIFVSFLRLRVYTTHTAERVRTYAIETPTGVDTYKFPNTIHLVGKVNGKIFPLPESSCKRDVPNRTSNETRFRPPKMTQPGRLPCQPLFLQYCFVWDKKRKMENI